MPHRSEIGVSRKLTLPGSGTKSDNRPTLHFGARLHPGDASQERLTTRTKAGLETVQKQQQVTLI